MVRQQQAELLLALESHDDDGHVRHEARPWPLGPEEAAQGLQPARDLARDLLPVVAIDGEAVGLQLDPLGGVGQPG